MLDSSADYKENIRATVRKPIAKLDVIWTDSTIDPTLSASSNDDNRVSWTQQTVDGNITSRRKWAHLSGDIIADGSFYPMPGTTEEAANNQMGWYSATACSALSVWSAPYPTLTVTMESRPVRGIFVSGDTEYNEFPVDFTVYIYDGVTLEYTEVITGNTELRYFKDITSEAILSADSMVLEITKWSAPERVVKITEFYTAFQTTFFRDDILSINLLEERVVGDGSLPIGNISCNEIDVSLNNINDDFFTDNIYSELATLIKPNRKIIPYLGLTLPDGTDEYVKLGTYWTGDWVVNENAVAAQVSARDRMELLRQAEFTSSVLYEDATLYELMEAVLDDAIDTIPMYDLVYQIDTELQDFTIPFAWFPKDTYFNTIKTIVEACMGQAYMNRDDVLVIEGPSFLNRRY